MIISNINIVKYQNINGKYYIINIFSKCNCDIIIFFNSPTIYVITITKKM